MKNQVFYYDAVFKQDEKIEDMTELYEDLKSFAKGEAFVMIGLSGPSGSGKSYFNDYKLIPTIFGLL